VLSIVVCPNEIWTARRFPVALSMIAAFVRRRECVPPAQANTNYPRQPAQRTRRPAWRAGSDTKLAKEKISVNALKQTDLEVAEGALKAGGPLLLQHRFQGLPQFAQATLTEPLRMDEHGALFGPGMMVHGGWQRLHVLFKRRSGGVELEGDRQQVGHLPMLGVGNHHVLTDRVYSGIEDVVLDVLVDLQCESASKRDPA